MKIKSWVYAAIMAILLSVCSLVLAEGWYAGVEGGYVTHTFKVHYEYADGSTPDDFTDLAHGAQGSFIGGRHPLSARRALAGLCPVPLHHLRQDLF